MNLKKNLGRVATAFLATAMLASLTAVPASALGGVDASGWDDASAIGSTGTVGAAGGEALTELKFNKVLLLPKDVKIPTVDFTFTLKDAKAGEGEKVTDANDHTAEVYDGVPYTATADADTETAGVQSKASFGASQEAERKTAHIEGATGGIADVDMVSEQVTFADLDDIAFDDAGIYKYVLIEEDLTAADSADYRAGSNHIVYVHVERYTDDDGADAYKITGISMVKANDPADGSDIYTPKTTIVGEGAEAVEQFVKADGNIYNFYQLEGGDPDDPEGEKDPEDEDDEEGNPDPDNPDPEDEDDPKPADNNAYIVKTVDGSMGNYNDDFEFSVSASPLVNGKTYNAYYEVYNEGTQAWEQDATKDRTDAITISANPTTITLSHNERLRIAGLSNNETYVANEKDYAATGYTTKIDLPGSAQDVTTASGTEGNKVYASGNVTFTKGDAGNHDQNVVTFTNTRNAVSPTGLAMNVAPYALLVVVAAGACFVFLRKRREDD